MLPISTDYKKKKKENLKHHNVLLDDFCRGRVIGEA